MNLIRRRLTASLVVLTLSVVAGGEAAEVLRFRTGHQMRVESYTVDGSVVRIIGLDGQHFVVRLEQVVVDPRRPRRSPTPAPTATPRTTPSPSPPRAAESRRGGSRRGRRGKPRPAASPGPDVSPTPRGFERPSLVEPPATRPAVPVELKPVPTATPVAQDPLPILPPREREAILLFEATWCGWCKRLEEEMARPGPAKVLADYDLLRYDFDQDAAIARLYRVSGVPTLIVVGVDGHVKKRLDRFLPAPQLVQWLNDLEPRRATSAR